MSALDPGVFDGVIRRTKENAQAADTARARSEYTTTEAQIVASTCEARYGASPEEWQHFIDLGLAAELLPIVCNPKAVISPESNLTALGKVPSRYNGARQVVGFHKWTGHRAKPAEVARWSREPDYGIGVQGRAVRALDVDIDDSELAQQVRDFIATRFSLPMRVRGGSRFLFAFRLEGEFPKRSVVCRDGKVEFLGNGQQWVAAGMHKSGARYEWAGGLPKEFPVLTAEEFKALWSDLGAQFGAAPATEARAATERPKGERIDMPDPIADYLHEKGLVLDEKTDGTLIVTCPWEKEHTTGTAGDGSTVYFPAGTNGQAEPGFKCLHGHCDARHLSQFLDAIGYVTTEFENLETQKAAALKQAEHLIESADIVGDSVLADLAALQEHFAAQEFDELMKRMGAALTGKAPPPPRFKLLTVEEFMQRPPVRWLVKGLLPQADLAVLYGDPGSGKSFLALDIALAIGRGVEWRGKRVQQGRVVYVACEGLGGLLNRVRAYAQAHNVVEGELPIRLVADAPNLLHPGDAGALKQQIELGGGADLVIIDTLARAIPGGNENSSEEMGAALARCQWIHEQTGALVLLVHHSGKDASKGARGWSGLRGAVATELEVNRADDARSVKVTKQKDGEDGEELTFRLETVVVGFDEDGEEITSCVVREGGPRPVMSTRRRGKHQHTLLTVLDTLLARDPAGVHVNDLRDAFIAQTPFAGGKRDERERRFGEALDKLKENLEVVVDGTRVRRV